MTRQPTMSRRTLAKGALWTVPAITVGATLPAFAASGGNVTVAGAGCSNQVTAATNILIFKVCAVTALIDIGSTFIYTYSAMTKAPTVTADNGTTFTTSPTSPSSTSGTLTIKLTNAIAAGTCTNFSILTNANSYASASFKAGTIVGNSNLITTDDQASYSFSIFGTC